MSSTSILPSSSAADTSRAAPWRARIQGAGIAIWDALEAYGSGRAQHELRALHDRWAVSDPARAQQLREAHAFLVSRGARQR